MTTTIENLNRCADLTESEMMAWARQTMQAVPVGNRQALNDARETVRKGWAIWSDVQNRRKPKVDSVTGEVIQAPEKHCIDCDALIPREEGKRRLPDRCPECQEKHREAKSSSNKPTESTESSSPGERQCSVCGKSFSYSGGRGRPPSKCPECKGS